MFTFPVSMIGGAGGISAVSNHATTEYTGTGSVQDIVNDLDMSSNGGVVFVRRTSGTGNMAIFDTSRGALKQIFANSNFSENTESNSVTAFNTDGFEIGAPGNFNASSTTYTSWCWEESSETFDITTYSGDGSAGKNVSHGLGVTPELMLVKDRTGSNDWFVYHKDIGNTKFLYLNDTSSAVTNSQAWNNTSPTSSQFTVGNSSSVNQSGHSYINYLFASKAGVCHIGNYSGSGASGKTVTGLGFEPSLIIVKNSSSTGDWSMLYDDSGTVTSVPLNTSLNVSTPSITFDSDGFTVNETGSNYNSSGATYIYAAWK